MCDVARQNNCHSFRIQRVFLHLVSYILGKSQFLPGGGAPENWGDQVLFLRSKGGPKDFFKLKRGDHLHSLKQ